MSGSRAESSLFLPDPARDYSNFPTYDHPDRLRWYRTHEDNLSPWWFSNSVGRFNLHSPRGTLNLGDSLETSIRERLGPVLLGAPDIPQASLTGLTVSCLEVPALVAADFLHSSAAAFGVLASDAAAPADPNYTVTRAWAAVFDEAGMDGIRTRSRCGSGQNPQNLYVFGDAGENEFGDVLDSESSSAQRVAADMTGYTVVQRPDSASLIIDP